MVLFSLNVSKVLVCALQVFIVKICIIRSRHTSVILCWTIVLSLHMKTGCQGKFLFEQPALGACCTVYTNSYRTNFKLRNITVIQEEEVKDWSKGFLHLCLVTLAWLLVAYKVFIMILQEVWLITGV